MQKDMGFHPNNGRKHKASDGTVRCYVKPGSTGAGSKGCLDASRVTNAKYRDNQPDS